MALNMSGPMMMLKALGLDPEAITKQIQDYGGIVVALKAQMDRIEQKLDEAIAQNNSKVGNGADLETKE